MLTSVVQVQVSTGGEKARALPLSVVLETTISRMMLVATDKNAGMVRRVMAGMADVQEAPAMVARKSLDMVVKKRVLDTVVNKRALDTVVNKRALDTVVKKRVLDTVARKALAMAVKNSPDMVVNKRALNMADALETRATTDNRSLSVTTGCPEVLVVTTSLAIEDTVKSTQAVAVMMKKKKKKKATVGTSVVVTAADMAVAAMETVKRASAAGTREKDLLF